VLERPKSISLFEKGNIGGKELLNPYLVIILSIEFAEFIKQVSAFMCQLRCTLIYLGWSCFINNKFIVKHNQFIIIRVATCFDSIGSSSSLHCEPDNYKAAYLLGIPNSVYK